MTIERLKTLVARRSWIYQKLPAAMYFGQPGAPATEFGDQITYRLKAPKWGDLPWCYYASRTHGSDEPEVKILWLLMDQIEEHILNEDFILDDSTD